MAQPLIKYGICPFGGNSYESSGSSADAVVATPTVRPQVLEWYARLGRFVCRQCIKRIDDDEKALRAAEKHRADDEFRSKAGFVTSVAASIPRYTLTEDGNYVMNADGDYVLMDGLYVKV